MGRRLGPKHQPRKHLAVRSRITGTSPVVACEANDIKMENVTSIPERVTCVPCRNSPRYIDVVARRLVQRGRRRPRKATR